MDELRPRGDERAFDEPAFDDDGDVELDSAVVGRLSAYGGAPAADDESAQPEPEDTEPEDPEREDMVPVWAGEPADPPPVSFASPRADEVEMDESSSLQADPGEDRPEPAAAGGGGIQVKAVDEGHVPADVALSFGPAANSGEAGEDAAVEAQEEGAEGGEERIPVVEATPSEAKPAKRRFGRGRKAAMSADGERAADEKTDKRGRRERKSKRLVGLKIGASQVVAAQVVNNGAPELVELVREPLEPGIVVFGEIRDPDALAAALKALFTTHKLPKRGIRLGLSNNRVGVRVFEVDGVVDPRQLENAIRFRAEEVLPIPLDQAVLDYAILEESTLPDGTPRKRILLVVAYRDVVDRYLQACALAGLEVVGIDHEAFALLRSLEAPEARDTAKGALIAAAIGHDRTTIAVSTGEQCEFARVLDWGGWSLNVAIARELDRAPSEVEQLKRQLSFAEETHVDGLDAVQVAKAREGMKRALDAFARELVSSLQFYQAQPGALGIGEIVLTGGTADMDGLPAALGELVGVPIRLGDPFKRLKLGSKVSYASQRGSLAIAIGLGIED